MKDVVHERTWLQASIHHVEVYIRMILTQSACIHLSHETDPVCGGDSEQAAQKKPQDGTAGQVRGGAGGMGGPEIGPPFSVAITTGSNVQETVPTTTFNLF